MLRERSKSNFCGTSVCSIILAPLKLECHLLLHPILTVEEYISVCLLGIDFEGLVTDLVTQDLIKNAAFLYDLVWEANTISSLRTDAVNTGQEFWVHPLT